MCVTSPEDIINDLFGVGVVPESIKLEVKKKGGKTSEIVDEADKGKSGKKESKLVNKDKTKDDSKDSEKTVIRGLKPVEISLTDEEKRLLDILSLEPTYIDNIIMAMGQNVSSTLSLLYEMEEKKLIRQVLKGYYIVDIT